MKNSPCGLYQSTLRIFYRKYYLYWDDRRSFSEKVASNHDWSCQNTTGRVWLLTWMSVLLTPMSVKVKTASKIRRDPARRRPAPTPNVRQLRKETEDFRTRLNTHLEANELKKETEEAEGMQIIVVSHPAFDHVASAVPSLSDMLLPA